MSPITKILTFQPLPISLISTYIFPRHFPSSHDYPLSKFHGSHLIFLWGISQSTPHSYREFGPDISVSPLNAPWSLLSKVFEVGTAYSDFQKMYCIVLTILFGEKYQINSVMMTNLFHFTLKMLGIETLGPVKADLPSNIIMAKASAYSEVVWFSTYLKKFKRKGTWESKGTPKLFSAYGQLVESIWQHKIFIFM